jgi:hypothetical protein
MAKAKALKKALLATIIILAVLPLGFFTLTGFYCKVPVWETGKDQPVQPGETVWYLRRGSDFGFVNSADGIAMSSGFSPNNDIRQNLDAEFERLEGKKVIARFGFSRAIYLKTTENADFSTPPETKKAPAP